MFQFSPLRNIHLACHAHVLSSGVTDEEYAAMYTGSQSAPVGFASTTRQTVDRVRGVFDNPHNYIVLALISAISLQTLLFSFLSPQFRCARIVCVVLFESACI
jgi:hypothetical protein